MTMPLPTRERGFTLVELAIVLMVIGLLIGGVLRGQEVLETARLNSEIKQVHSYTGAVAAFRDAYGMYPGDMSIAMQRVPGCTAANSCANGNGNSVIGTPIAFWLGGQSGITTENTQFWKHLAAAKLISGISLNANTPEWGRSHPVAPGTGGFTLIATQEAGEGSFPTGTMVLRHHGSLTNPGIIEEEPSLSPKQAGFIDRKMDDGLPATGNVRSKAHGNGLVVAPCEAAYNNEERQFCVMAFVFNI